MLTESGLMSPWSPNGDLYNIMLTDIINDDSNTNSNLLDFDFDIANLESEIDRVKYQNDQIWEETRQMNRALSSSSASDYSVASSDCSDDLLLDFDDPLLPQPEDSINSNLNSSLLNLDYQMSDSWNSTSSSSDTSSNSLLTTMSNSSSSSSKNSATTQSPCKKKNENVTNKSISSSVNFRNNKKSWSRMTDDEQLTTIEELSQIISQQLELRDQLEVIGIISPQARLLPTDTAFVIDQDDLDDRKLQTIRDYLHRRITVELVVSRSHNSTTNTSSSPPTPKKNIKRNPKERRSQLTKELRQRQRKEYRQLMKEKRSGLFRKEEVLSLTNCSPSDDEPDDDLIDIE